MALPGAPIAMPALFWFRQGSGAPFEQARQETGEGAGFWLICVKAL